MFRRLLNGEKYASRVGAEFETAEEADAAVRALQDDRHSGSFTIRVIRPGDPNIDTKLEPESEGIARTMLRAHVATGLVGLACGVSLAAVQVLLDMQPAASSPGLTFYAFSTVGLLLGLLAGGLVGFRPDHDPLIYSAREASDAGHAYVVVHAKGPEDRQAAVHVLDRYSDRRQKSL